MDAIKKFLILFFALIMITPSFAKPSGAISYTETGSGPPLVLIHAFPTDYRLWAPQLEGLKQHYHVIAIDLSGFGQSGVTDGQAIPMRQYADEVKQLLNQLHIPKAIIGGESMGGYVALAFLKHYPGSVEALVLSGTQPIADSPEVKLKREKTAQDVLLNGTSQFIRDFLPKAISSNASSETRAHLQAILESQTPTAIASALRGMALREDLSDLLSKTDLPVLIIAGEQDALISTQQSQYMHALAKNSELIMIPNAGHLVNLEQPELWNQALVDFFIY